MLWVSSANRSFAKDFVPISESCYLQLRGGTQSYSIISILSSSFLRKVRSFPSAVIFCNFGKTLFPAFFSLSLSLAFTFGLQVSENSAIKEALSAPLLSAFAKFFNWHPWRHGWKVEEAIKPFLDDEKQHVCTSACPDSPETLGLKWPFRKWPPQSEQGVKMAVLVTADSPQTFTAFQQCLSVAMVYW